MESETLSVDDQGSTHSNLGQLILSISELRRHDGAVEFVVGRIGFPNVSRKMRTGGAILFETPDEGLIEVRVLSLNSSSYRAGKVRDFVEFQVSRVAPIAGIRAGFVEQDGSNLPFSADEIRRIAVSVDEIHVAAQTRNDVTPEQLDLLRRKLDEMTEAASHLGRRDWINLAVGTLTNIVVAAAFESGFARFLFRTAGAALQWLFGGSMKFLP